MQLGGRHLYCVITFGPETVRVCRFRRVGVKYRLVRFASAENLPDDPGRALKNALEQCDCSGASCIIISGPVRGASAFRCAGSSLSVREQKSALRFELPLRMPQVPDDCVIQYSSFKAAEASAPENLSVYAFPASGLHRVAAMLTRARCKADEFISPTLAVRPDDPPVYFSSMEKDFCWCGGEWRPVSDCPESWLTDWRKLLDETVILPDDASFKPEQWMEALVLMRFLAHPVPGHNSTSIQVLPGQLRPGRWRVQIMISTLLCLGLALIWGWKEGAHRFEHYTQYQQLLNERDNARQKIATLKAQLKKSDKELRELNRITHLSAGDPVLLTKIYDLASVLPDQALVTSFRFNDGRLDLVIQSENSEGSLSSGLKKIPYWKISELQQRSMGSDSVSMTIIRLSPVEEE